MSDQEFEFTAEHNAVFKDLLKWLNLFSLLFIVAGVLIAVVAALMITGSEGMNALPGVGISLVMIALGVLFRRPMDNIRNITETEGRDISELMVAMKDFTQAFLSGAVIGLIFVGLVIWRLLVLFTG